MATSLLAADVDAVLARAQQAHGAPGGPFPSPADWRDQWIYFLMLDRFSHPGAAPRHLPFDDLGFADFQGGTFSGVAEKLPYLKALGMGAIWLSPVLKNLPFRPTHHGYGIHHFLHAEPRFADDPAHADDDLGALVIAAHAQDLFRAADFNPAGVPALEGLRMAAPDAVLPHLNAWQQFDNTTFTLVASGGNMRVPRASGGYWLYLGTGVFTIPADEPTVNLRSFPMDTPESRHRVLRCETDHTLGYPDERTCKQTVNAVDRNKAVTFYRQPPSDWSPEIVIARMFTPLDNSALRATELADDQPITCNALPAEIMIDRVGVPGGSDIDTLDSQFSAHAQETMAKLLRSVTAVSPQKDADGEQATRTHSRSLLSSGLLT